MERRLESLVRGHGQLQADPCGACQRWGGLLSEVAESVGGALEVAAVGRVGVGQQTHGQADDDRVDSREVHRDPGGEAEGEVCESLADTQPRERQDSREEGEGHQQGYDVELGCVDRRNHEQSDHVVDDHHGKQEGAQSLGEPWADQCEHPEREGGVCRHGHTPAPSGGLTGVDHQEQQDGHGHANDSGGDRQDHPAPLTQLAEVELASGLQAHDEEEEGHQEAVHPADQVHRHTRTTDLDRQHGAPERLVRSACHVGPDQRRDGGSQEHRGTSALGAQEPAHRRLAAPGPVSVAGVAGRLWRLTFSHDVRAVTQSWLRGRAPRSAGSGACGGNRSAAGAAAAPAGAASPARRECC